MHDVVEPHETASTPSPVTSMLSGFDQTWPFQVRASPPSTAMQNEALRQDTSISANAPPGSNDVFSFQVVPLSVTEPPYQSTPTQNRAVRRQRADAAAGAVGRRIHEPRL